VENEAGDYETHVDEKYFAKDELPRRFSFGNLYSKNFEYDGEEDRGDGGAGRHSLSGLEDDEEDFGGDDKFDSYYDDQYDDDDEFYDDDRFADDDDRLFRTSLTSTQCMGSINSATNCDWLFRATPHFNSKRDAVKLSEALADFTVRRKVDRT
jgi:hypothetical protein